MHSPFVLMIVFLFGFVLHSNLFSVHNCLVLKERPAAIWFTEGASGSLASEQVAIAKNVAAESVWIKENFKTAPGADGETSGSDLLGTVDYPDPFQDFAKRQSIPNETVWEVLKLSQDSNPCFETNLHLPPNGLDRLASVLYKKKFGEPIVIGVLGDSVAARKPGFGQALQSYLALRLSGWKFEVRNFAKGGTGPKFTLYCNKLKGDEDIIIFEDVRPHEADSLVELASGLVKGGAALLLVEWRGVQHMKDLLDDKLFGFKEASDSLKLPLIQMNHDPESFVVCLPEDIRRPFNGTLLEEQVQHIYSDEIHPNYHGDILIAAHLGRLFERATIPPAPQMTVAPESLAAVYSKLPICYTHLNCTDTTIIGRNTCLLAKTVGGFVLRKNNKTANHKTWWEGTQPGHFIELFLSQPCTSVVVFRNLRPTNGMVQVEIDGSLLNAANSDLEDSTLDGWFAGFDWMPRERGHLKEKIIARDLELKPHTVRLTVLKETHSEDGTYKFDFTAIVGIK